MGLILSRRTLFAGAFSLAGAAAIGLGSFAAYDFTDLIWQILKRLLGDFEMAEADMAAFSRDFTRPIDLDGWTGKMLRAAGLTGTEDFLNVHGPPEVHERFEGFERSVLGAFMMSTNFLDIHAEGGGRVVYHGLDVPCSSPFARFDFT